MADRVDINEWVALESSNTQNDFEFKKIVPVTTVPEVIASFLLITYARPNAVGLGGGGHWRGGAKGFAASLLTAFNLQGHATIRFLGLPHRMYLLVPTRHSGVVWLVLLHFPQGSIEPVGWLLGGAGKGFSWFTLLLRVPYSIPFLFWLIGFKALNSAFTRSTSAACSCSSW